MRFTVKKENLIRGLDVVRRFYSPRSEGMWSGIKMIAKDRILTFSTATIETTSESSVEVETFEEGSNVLPGKIFDEMAGKLPEGDIDFNIDGVSAKITANNFSMTLPVMSGSDDFPQINQGICVASFTQKKLKNFIRKTLYATSSEANTIKPFLTGVLVETDKNNRLNFVALDGFRISWISTESHGPAFSAIIPGKVLAEISKLYSTDDDVNIFISKKTAVFETKDFRIMSRLLEGQFINYGQVINSSNCKYEVTVNRDDLINGIDCAKTIAQQNSKNNFVKLHFAENYLEVCAEGELGNVKQNITLTGPTEDLIIGFNAQFLYDALKEQDSDEVVLMYSDNVSPLIIKPKTSEEGYDYFNFVLPIKMKQSEDN